MIISRTASDPSRSFDDTSSAYCIQTQFAHPLIQQLVGGGGIFRKKKQWNEYKNEFCENWWSTESIIIAAAV